MYQIEEPVKLVSEQSDIFKKQLKKCNSNSSLCRSSFSSNCSSAGEEEDDNNTFNKRNNQLRVSFEIQSSDNEPLNDSAHSQNCIDILSPQRISLLNLVQIAKLKINKLHFFTISNLNSLLEQHLSSTSAQKQINSRTKPPLATKKTEFFIEYQFPVVTKNSQIHIATQVMRVNAKKLKTDSEDIISFDHEADYSVLFNSSSLETWWRSAIVFKIYCRLNNTTTPFLIAMARLSLRNALKSRNFKLYKKLAVLDQLNESSKRIGTLHVSIELTSDIKEFNTDLVKLKNKENTGYKKPVKSLTSQSTPCIRAPEKVRHIIVEKFFFC